MKVNFGRKNKERKKLRDCIYCFGNYVSLNVIRYRNASFFHALPFGIAHAHISNWMMLTSLALSPITGVIWLRSIFTFPAF